MYMEVERKYLYMYIFFNKYTIIPCSNMVNLSMINTSWIIYPTLREKGSSIF